MDNLEENITITGVTSDGVLVSKTITDEDGVSLVELAEAIKVFVKAFGYEYVEGVVFESSMASHGSSGSTYDWNF